MTAMPLSVVSAYALIKARKSRNQIASPSSRRRPMGAAELLESLLMRAPREMSVRHHLHVPLSNVVQAACQRCRVVVPARRAADQGDQALLASLPARRTRRRLPP